MAATPKALAGNGLNIKVAFLYLKRVNAILNYRLAQKPRGKKNDHKLS
jgi:hypothetical protein